MTTEQSDSVDHPNLGRRVAKGATWVALLRFSVRSIGLVSTIILARLLVPQDFGLVALAMMTVALLDTMAQFGFESALVRDQKAGRAHYDTAWTLAVLRGLCTALVLVAAAEPIARFYEDDRLETILYVLALIPVVQGFRNVGIVNFQKNLHFRKEFQLRVMMKFSAFFVVVPLAYLWRDYWALVAGLLTSRTVGLILSYVMHPYRPRLSLAEWRPLINFGKWMLGYNILSFFGQKLDIILLGKFLDAKTVGIYSVSHEISSLPTTEITLPISRALFPGYAKIADDRDRMVEGYLIALAFMIAVAGPLGIGIAVTAEHIIRVFLGVKWLEALPFITILAIYGVFRLPAGALTGPVLLALNRPSLLTYMTLTTIAVRAPVLLVGVIYFGALGVAWGMVIAGAFGLAINVGMVLRVLQIPLVSVVKAVWRSVVSLCVMVVAVKMLDIQSPASATTWIAAGELAVLVLWGAVTYISTHLGLWRLSGLPDGVERHILIVLRDGVAKMRAKARPAH